MSRLSCQKTVKIVRTEKEKKIVGTKKEMKKKNAKRTLRMIKLEKEMYPLHFLAMRGQFCAFSFLRNY